MTTKMNERKATLADAISEACGVIEELASEMRDAYDNTPESLQQSAVGEARGEAADNLENISEPDVPESLGNREVTWYERVRTPRQLAKMPRRERRDGATQILQECVTFLAEIADDEKNSQDLRDEASSLADDLDNIVSEADNVEFPGMRG